MLQDVVVEGRSALCFVNCRVVGRTNCHANLVALSFENHAMREAGRVTPCGWRVPLYMPSLQPSLGYRF
jgi:hypothetical protein